MLQTMNVTCRDSESVSHLLIRSDVCSFPAVYIPPTHTATHTITPPYTHRRYSFTAEGVRAMFAASNGGKAKGKLVLTFPA